MESASDRNQTPILEVLKEYIVKDTRLLEIGSGSGQHAVYMAKNLSFLHWVTSEMKSQHKNIKDLLKKEKLKNVHGPESLEIGKDDFPKGVFDYVFTANTLHIMPWKKDKAMIKLLGRRLREGSLVFIYGPFNYGGAFTSESNQIFDERLKQRNASAGIRSFEDVESNMIKAGFKLLKDHEMPANNRFLVFERLEFQK